MIAVDFWKALQAGKELRNPETWKKSQNVANAVAGIVGFIVAVMPLAGVNVPISETDQATLATGMAAILGVINVILTTATTKRIGITTGK